MSVNTIVNNSSTSSSEPIYVDLASESDDPSVTQIQSLCMQCQEQGMTRLLMTRIPHYREVILTSFSCEHCGERNTGVQCAAYQDFAVNYQLTVSSPKDLNRQIVTSGETKVSIPEVELEIPPNLEKGEVTTVEGIIQKTQSNLQNDQEQRRLLQPNVADQIDIFIDKLNNLLNLESNFTITLDDPTGNTFVESLNVGNSTDSRLNKTLYKRSEDKKQDELNHQTEVDRLPTITDKEEEEEEEEEECDVDKNKGDNESSSLSNKEDKKDEDQHGDNIINLKEEVLSFDSLCGKCTTPVRTNMKVVAIPHFKEVIIMATTCDNCGFKSNEVKSGSGISDKGRKTSLRLTDFTIDLARDVLKSDTCDVSIPELDLFVGAGILGGKFTTVEGLLKNIKDDLSNNPFFSGDSSSDGTKSIMNKLLADLDEVMECKFPCTLVLDDPAGNSYLQNVYAPDVDPELLVEEYERTYDQNDDLGLNDMKTENYAEDS